MIIPIRCQSCGKPVAHLYDQYLEGIKAGEQKGKILTDLKLKRYCCRSTFLSHVDLLKSIAQFKKH